MNNRVLKAPARVRPSLGPIIMAQIQAELLAKKSQDKKEKKK